MWYDRRPSSPPFFAAPPFFFFILSLTRNPLHPFTTFLQSALFKGYLATWLKIGPFTVAQFWIWEQSMRYVSDRQDLPQAYSADES